MTKQQEMETAIAELSMRGDVVWLATRLRSDPRDEQGSWPRRINVHIKFFSALRDAGCLEGIWVDLVSHEKRGRALPRYVRRRVFLEWDIESESSSLDGIWMAFTIFALIPNEDEPKLWCWVCESAEEEEFAEAVFAWSEPQSFAYARGVPLFPERFSQLNEY